VNEFEICDRNNLRVMNQNQTNSIDNNAMAIHSIQNDHSYARRDAIQNIEINLSSINSRELRTPRRQTYIEDNLKVHSLGAMNLTCHFCKAFYFQAETTKNDKVFTKCCIRGKYLFDFNFEIPNSIKMLICNANPESKNCCENITENSILL